MFQISPQGSSTPLSNKPLSLALSTSRNARLCSGPDQTQHKSAASVLSSLHHLKSTNRTQLGPSCQMEISGNGGERSAGGKAASAMPCTERAEATGYSRRHKFCSSLGLTKERHLLSQVSGWGSARTGDCRSYSFYSSSKQRMGLEKIQTNTLNISPHKGRNPFTVQQSASAVKDVLLAHAPGYIFQNTTA